MSETDTLVPEKLAALRERANMVHAGAWHTIEIALEFITPVLGGGTESGEIDALLPIRPRAIRNQFKHWWWLQNGHAYKDAEELYKAMVAIWGGPADRDGCPEALVRIEVNSPPVSDEQLMPYLPIKTGKREDVNGRSVYTVNTDPESPCFYALWGAAPIIKKEDRNNFAAQQAFSEAKKEAYEKNKKPIGRDPFNPEFRAQANAMASIESLYDEKQPIRRLLLPGYTWKLSVQVSKRLHEVQTKQVRDAIWAWLMLGGYGARTQRGLGRSRVCQKTVSDSAFDVLSDEWNTRAEWFRALFGDLHTEVPKTARPNAVVAWDWAIGIYKQFRQARQFDQRNSQRQKQSFGHLANGIRKATGHLGHPIPQALGAGGGLHKYTPFSEVLFGAPIVYLFKKPGRHESGGKEPADGVVSFSRGGEDTLSRYSSPLWVTVARTNDGHYMPVAACLKEHMSDVQGLSVAVGGHQVPWGAWWPDLATESGVKDASRLLGHEARNPPQTGAPPDWKSSPPPYGQDMLYDAIVKNAVGNQRRPVNGDPIVVFLNFMRDFPV